MKAVGQSDKSHSVNRRDSGAAISDTTRISVGFLMVYMTAIFLNAGQSNGLNSTTSRFAAAFLTLFIAIFVLNKGKLGLGPIYLLVVLIAPELGRAAMVGTLFVLYYFLLQDTSS